MSPLWVLPVVVLLCGAAAAFVTLRRLRVAVSDLRAQLVRLDEVRVAVADVRAEAVRSREAIARLRRQ